jgi:hypothetical protein
MDREYNDGTEPTSLPHYTFCNGPCDQGRKACPCPVACEREDPSMSGFEILGKLVIVVLALVGAGVIVGYFV